MAMRPTDVAFTVLFPDIFPCCFNQSPLTSKQGNISPIAPSCVHISTNLSQAGGSRSSRVSRFSLARPTSLVQAGLRPNTGGPRRTAPFLTLVHTGGEQLGRRYSLAAQVVARERHEEHEHYHCPVLEPPLLAFTLVSRDVQTSKPAQSDPMSPRAHVAKLSQCVVICFELWWDETTFVPTRGVLRAFAFPLRAVALLIIAVLNSGHWRKTQSLSGAGAPSGTLTASSTRLFSNPAGWCIHAIGDFAD